jgi:predicted unusual protein kinase regulating ubiquinone biosynthesis (AarF/ABC1/UbiB family)
MNVAAASGDDLVRSVAADDFELVLLDAGLVVELQPEDRRNFADLFGAVVLGDGQLAGSLLLERARHHDCPNPAAFKNAVRYISMPIRCLYGHRRSQSSSIGPRRRSEGPTPARRSRE